MAPPPRTFNPRAALVAAALVAALTALALWKTARTRRALWWSRAEAICQCGSETRRELVGLTHIGAGGLAEVAHSELRSLSGDCDDLRAAMDRRSLRAELRKSPLRVDISDGHRRAVEELGRALGKMCGPENQPFWSALTARAAGPAPSDEDEARLLYRSVQEYLRVHDGMCARRDHLAAAPRGYSLTAGDAADLASACTH